MYFFCNVKPFFMPIWFLSRESWHVSEGEGYEGNKALFSLLNRLIVTSRQRFVLRWDKSFMSDNKRVSGHSSHPTGRSSDIKKRSLWFQIPKLRLIPTARAVRYILKMCARCQPKSLKKSALTCPCGVTDLTESQFIAYSVKSHWTWLSASVSWAETHCSVKLNPMLRNH